MPKRIRDIIKMKATQHRIVGKANFLEPAKLIPWSFYLIAWSKYRKAEARSMRLHTTVEMSLDLVYVDKTESSLKADIQPPWADIPQSALGSAKSQHPPKCGTQQCTPQTVSARSLGHYAWGCISDILSPKDIWGYGYDPSQSIGSAIKHQHDKGILKTRIKA
jgi:hypothetical protein